MAFAHIAAVVALRRLSHRHPVAELLVQRRDATLAAIRHASRHAWLALEIATGGAPLWQRITDSLSSAEGNVFRQQMEALLDLLNLAGLRGENPATLNCCRAELRSARQSGALQSDLDDALQANDAALLIQQLSDAERPWLEQMARGFEHSGYPYLARLASLSSSWDQALLVGIFEYFLQNALRQNATTSDADHGGLSWRCLEMIARLLKDCDEALIAVLDHVEDAGEERPARRRDDEIQKILQLGLGCLKAAQYQQAASHFTAALKFDPGNPLLFSNRGEAYRLQCEYERAIADFDVALVLNPADCATLVNRAAAHQLSGAHARAIADCSAALSRHRHNPAAYCTRAAAHAALGEYDRAIADFSEAINQAPHNDGILYQRALIHEEHEAFALAISDFDRIVALNPNHVLAFLHRGQAHLALGNYRQAIADFSETLRHHPNNALACTGRGHAHHLSGDVDRAIADYTTALQLEPTNAQTYCRRGILYRGKGELLKALADLNEAIRREPEYPAALYHRGKIFLFQARFEDAVADFTEALNLQPRLVVAYLSRALAHDRLGLYEEGLADTAEAIKLNPQAPAAYLLRGILLAHTGDYATAVEQFSQVIALDDQYALAYQERSTALLLRRDYPRALADCDQVLTLEPRNAVAYANRSVVLHLMGKVQQSLTDYTRAMRIDPKCMLAISNPRLAERSRQQATQRLAGYIDGLRPEPSANQAPPRINFSIQIERAGTKKAQRVTATHAINETVTFAKVETLIATESLPAETQDPPSDTPVRKRTKLIASNATPETALENSVETEQPPEDSSNSATPAVAEAEEHTNTFELTTDAPPEPAGEAEVSADIEIDAGSPSEEDQEIAVEEETAGADCPLCGAAGTGHPLSGGRFSCASCGKVFYPSSLADSLPSVSKKTVNPEPAPTSRPKKTAKKRADDDEREPLVTKLKKPLPLAAAGALAAVIMLCFCFPMSMFGNDRARVYPARGAALFAGKPMLNASILLHPADEKEPNFPRPKATVNEDGAFVLGTYSKDDGAPAGEYIVTMQWFGKQDARVSEDAPPPVNRLPARYANPKTSRLTVRIQAGENKLPTLNLGL